ncbi:hypothetical protein ruthe_03213 [Rubellimicrobium thermophilum DSM 16684]|uniref:Uncharacterized protein n=1 Tax=Rubellimicrobium thermophilum DSM 16684 TaxID=1123069 RepID=S9QMS1_9RHOB|nr:hypothetical protein [Rubellimicrobium thermophilum]EPX82751.1 hypothetical protein ruthe_03213 [Rubellimicrobium thermophilum DSM 16684]
MTQPSAPATPQTGAVPPAQADETRQMEAAEPRPRLTAQPGHPAAFSTSGGGVIFSDYASI